MNIKSIYIYFTGYTLQVTFDGLGDEYETNYRIT